MTPFAKVALLQGRFLVSAYLFIVEIIYNCGGRSYLHYKLGKSVCVCVFVFLTAIDSLNS